jgi:hypothetical protein
MVSGWIFAITISERSDVQLFVTRKGRAALLLPQGHAVVNITFVYDVTNKPK